MCSDDDLTLSDRSAGVSKLAVIAALGVERGCFRSRSYPFMLIQSGPGPARATAAAREAIRTGATALLSWGLAGALVPELQTGSVVVPRAVVSEDGYCSSASGSWRDSIASALDGYRVYDEKLLSVHKTLLGPAQKSAAARSHGAIACDMESAAIAAVAGRAGASFAAIRVIADGLYDRLPEDVERFVDVSGNSRVLPLLSAAIKPGQWKSILLVGRRFAEARRSLTEVADRLAPRAFVG